MLVYYYTMLVYYMTETACGQRGTAHAGALPQPRPSTYRTLSDISLYMSSVYGQFS